LYDILSIDPETLPGISDPGYSDAVFYTVECQDYGYFSGTLVERAHVYLCAGEKVDAGLKRFSSILFGDFPCVFCPSASQDQTRPTHLSLENIPTLVLGTTADPATPTSNGLCTYQHFVNSYMVTEEGGPHIVFSRANACPDVLVTAFKVEGFLPALLETICAGVITYDFVPLSSLTASDFENPLKTLNAAFPVIHYLPEYYYWDTITPTTTGCPLGGSLAFESSNSGDAFNLVECTFSKALSLTGTDEYNIYDDIFP
jgi:hypothetical protein